MYKRFWLTDKIESDMFEIAGEEHVHLANVLRMKVGDKIIVTCNDLNDYICEVLEITKKSTKCRVLSKELNKHNPNKHLDVFQALIKNDKMSLVTQKLNEIGVKNLVLFETKNQTVKPSDNKKEKLQKISDQSAKQCKRSVSMKVSDTISFESMLQLLENYDMVLFANESESNTNLNTLANRLVNLQKVAIIIGSEGGFSEEEIKKILENNALSVSLGNRILRAETASITLAGFVSFMMNN